MSTSGKIPTRELNDGSIMPLIGYGTGTALFKTSNFDSIDRSTVDAIKVAIQAGYTHLDGAELYNTEPELGAAIRESQVPRSQLFITTKVINNIHNIPGAIDASLRKLQLEYVDLYLIHSPWFASSDAQLQSAWREMEKVQRAGKARSIGVSNYLPQHLEATLATATIPPSVNQVEFHPYLQRRALRSYCTSTSAKGKGIAVSAFGPLTTITKAQPGPCDAVFSSLARKYGFSQEAVALRWCVDQGIPAITTSSKEARLRDYLGATTFQLTDDEIKEIASKGDEKHFRANNFMHKFAEDDRS